MKTWCSSFFLSTIKDFSASDKLSTKSRRGTRSALENFRFNMKGKSKKSTRACFKINFSNGNEFDKGKKNKVGRKCVYDKNIRIFS